MRDRYHFMRRGGIGAITLQFDEMNALGVGFWVPVQVMCKCKSDFTNNFTQAQKHKRQVCICTALQ
jgi:hypothetical protein